MKRIKTIAEYIPPYRRIADIGCDHGYLILEAFEKYDIEFAQAIDNKKGPLSAAKSNLINYQRQVLFSLSDGLTELDSSIDVVIIAGMGGMLIKDILASGTEKLKNIKRIIIQANKDNYEVRKYATQIGFKIASEKIIEEESIYYEIIVLEKGLCKYNNSQLLFGPILMEERNRLFINKWKKEISRLKNIDNSIPQKKAKVIEERLNLEALDEN